MRHGGGGARRTPEEPRADRTLMEMLAAVAGLHPEAAAAVEPAAAEDRRMTYGALFEAVGGLRAALADRGIGRGDVVAVWLPNWLETLVWQFAVTSLGAAVLGINTRYHVHELAHLLRRAEPRCVALPHAFLTIDFPVRLREAVALVRADAADVTTPQVAVVRAPSGAGLADFDVGGGVWAAAGGMTATWPSGEGGFATDLANLFTTSGTTSAPKLAGHDQQSVVTHSGNVATALGLRPGDAVACVLPLSGVFGFTPAMAALSVGATCVLHPVFDAGELLATMDREGVTHLVAGDDLFVRLREAWMSRRVRLAAWRGGGIADFVGRVREILDWAEEEFGARVGGIYGSSELFALTAMWDPELALDRRAVAGGSVVSPAIEVRVADPEGRRMLPPGDPGELQFRGYNVTGGYLRDPDATAQAFTGDGWFRSGDLGRLLADEGFQYLCRRGDALRLRGFLVNPSEIESFLAAHPTVEVAKVVGASDRAGGDVAVAFVTAHDRGCSEDELLAWCRQRLAPFKVPVRVLVIDRFPTTTGTNGPKIRTAVLRAQAADLVRRR